MEVSVTGTMIPGGWTDCENDSKVREVGEFAVEEYDKEQDKNLEFVKVLNGQIHTVNGVVMYTLQLEAKDDDGPTVCETQVSVQSDDSMKLLEFNIVETKKKMADSVAKKMADSVPATMIVGGWTDCENDLMVQEVGEFAVNEYNKEQEKSLEFVRVLKAQKQIVNGVMYKLFLEAKYDNGRKLCETLVYVKFNDSMKLLEFNFVEFDQEIIGGWTDAGNDVGIENLAKFAVDEYNKKEGSTLEFTKLKNAQKQLVEGILYRLTLEASDDGHNKLYRAMVIVISWKGIKELKDFKLLLMNDED